MVNKLDVKAIANALAVITVILYVICFALLKFAPQQGVTFFNFFIHGLDITPNLKPAAEITFSYAIISTIIGVIAVWLTGALFAWIYNKLAK